MGAMTGEMMPCNAGDAQSAPRGVALAAMLSSGIWIGLVITLWTVW